MTDVREALAELLRVMPDSREDDPNLPEIQAAYAAARAALTQEPENGRPESMDTCNYSGGYLVDGVDAARECDQHRPPPVKRNLITSQEAEIEIMAEQRGEKIAAEMLCARIRALAEGLDK